MGRYSSGMVATIAGTSARPIAALLNTASVSAQLRELRAFNTTAVSCDFKLVALTAGTAGTAQTARRHRRNSPAAATAFRAGWTADATIGEDLGYGFTLGAAIGSGAILTFGQDGLEVDLGSTSALGVIPVGTGQILRIEMTWDE